MSLEEIDNIFITQEEVGERLDKILANRFTGIYSRTYFQYLIDQQLVLLNGEPVKKRIKPSIDDEIEIEFAALPEISLKPEKIPLDIVYEDDYILAINKPVGMVIHPAVGHWDGTFVNALLYHCQELAKIEDSLRPGIVHRLDKDTSGILLAAKTLEAQQKLIELFSSRNVYKEYLAVCLGHPVNKEIVSSIGRDPANRKKMKVVPNGKKAISICKSLGYNGKIGFARVVILTGRTHQIRVHFQNERTPILGDDLYGNSATNRQYKADRQLLHASILRFVHPITGKEMELKANLPVDMQHYYDLLVKEKGE